MPNGWSESQADAVDLEVLVGLAALALSVTCVIAGVYIHHVYRQISERPEAKEARFLTRLVHRDLRVSAASGVIALLVVNSYIGTGPLPRPWGALLVGGALMVMMAGPIGDALLWRKERQR